MPTQVQFRRGNEGQNNNFKGAAGEISVNTSTNSIRVHNGIATGGFELARADLSNVGNVSLSGIVTATAFVGDGSGLTGIQDLTGPWTSGQVGIYTNSYVGIGTTNPEYDLHVIGNARITGILTVGNASITIDGNTNNIVIGSGVTVYGNTGIISATAFYVGDVDLASASGYASTAGIATVASGLTTTASVNTSGIITATRFIGDGSGLTNIVATGTGVEVRDNGSVVGTARTLDFGNNLDVTFSAGIMTVTGASGAEFLKNESGISTTSSVGIGTTQPVAKLHVNGAIALSASPIFMGKNTVEESVTVPSGYNAMSIGPILTVGTGVTVTVEAGANWFVLGQ